MAVSATNEMEILNQTCLKFKSFCGQNLDFQKFPQKAETRDTRNFEKDKMICNITAESTRNPAGLVLSKASNIHRTQVDSFHKFNGTSVFILTSAI